MNSKLAVMMSFLTMGNAQNGKNTLGKGWDVANSDFWNYRDIYGLTFYKDMPDECFVDAACRHTSATRKEVFHSVEEWTKFNSQSLGISGGGPVNPTLSATVSASFSSSGSTGWTSERQSFYLDVYNRRKCFQIKSDCVNDKAHLNPKVEEVMKSLPKSGTDEASMKPWAQNFIKQFGSHINVASEHGGRIKIFQSVESQTQTDTSCLQQSVCASVKIAQTAEAGLCPNRTKCSTAKGVDSLETLNCALVGGDGNTVSAELCGNDVSVEKIKAFLDSGDMNDPSSATQFTFQPISNVVRFMGFQEEADMVEKAAEYHACVEPRFKWVASGSTHGCQCNLQCNSVTSTLDEDSCTCKCKGDVHHGFGGPKCERDYGHCVRGQGTSVKNACKGDNICESAISRETCKNSEVCCMSYWYGKCCPFGSSCNCPAFGRDCDCVPGALSDELDNSTVVPADLVV